MYHEALKFMDTNPTPFELIPRLVRYRKLIDVAYTHLQKSIDHTMREEGHVRKSNGFNNCCFIVLG